MTPPKYIKNACFLIAILLCSVSKFAVAQNNIMPSVSQGLGSGNASAVSRYFGQVVDLNINATQSTYSSTQAQMVLRDFFDKNRVQRFDIQRSAMNPGNRGGFTIGQLNTSTGVYKVYYSVRQKDNSYVVQELRIER